MPVPFCAGVTIGGIIYDLCLRAGLESADPTTLSDLAKHKVDGYVIGRPVTLRGAIEPLGIHTPFDCVESTYNWEGHVYSSVLYFIARGSAIVADLSADDLCAHASGESRPAAVEVTRKQDVELPKRVRVHYAQTNQNYEMGEQTASRVSVSTQVEADVEAPIAMTETKAAQTAEVALYEAWVSRNAYRLSVGAKWMKLEPGDAITIPVDGRQERVRIVDVQHRLPSSLSLSCVADDDGAFQATAIGSESAYGGPAEIEMDAAGVPKFVVMDLPIVRTTEADAGYYVAVCSVGSTYFAGSVIYRAIDGVTYDEAGNTEMEAALGVLDADLPAGPTTIWDNGNELIVTLDAGELESFPEASVLLGKNAAAVGADGRWEILQYRNAELIESSPQTNTWRLTGLLRGRRGTEWAVGTGLAGDAFVLMDEAVMRLPLEIPRIGGLLSHKALIAGGGELEDAVAEDFTPAGVALKPFSPINFVAVDDGGDIDISWTRRSRAGSELMSGAEIPLLELDERYEVDIIAESNLSIVVRTISVTSPAVTYTAAAQALDFGGGPAPPLRIRIYQISAAVGRGYVLEGSY